MNQGHCCPHIPTCLGSVVSSCQAAPPSHAIPPAPLPSPGAAPCPSVGAGQGMARWRGRQPWLPAGASQPSTARAPHLLTSVPLGK